MAWRILCNVLSKNKGIKEENLSGKKLETIERELTETLDVTERAFEIMLEELYEKDIMDVEIDLKLLRMLIAKDGRKDPDFDLS